MVPVPSPGYYPPVTRAQNMAAQQRLAEIVNAGELDRLGEVFADDVVDHDPAPAQGPGIDGVREFFTSLLKAFPDAQLHVDTMVADDDQVAIACRLTGTHKGAFLGVKKSGKSVQVRVLQVARFRGGKIVERWGSTDELGILQQIEADEVPAPPGKGGLSPTRVAVGVAAAAGVAAAMASRSGDDDSDDTDADVTATAVVDREAAPAVDQDQDQDPSMVQPIVAPVHKDAMPTHGPDDGARL